MALSTASKKDAADWAVSESDSDSTYSLQGPSQSPFPLFEALCKNETRDRNSMCDVFFVTRVSTYRLSFSLLLLY